ncbi:MAG: septation protein IspZ [Proteobacteria bacterium]|jgi:intracellular septation protein|nr:septation protein IspZ [Alphaproteobacteria bacterium]MBL6850358.1 septation protein IspZ [Alphaproteobacteria bacterium]MDA0915764.1 septation protein IspZ [Pseudomonadota bacterium]
MRLSAFFFEIVPLSGFFISAQYYNLIISAIISLILSVLVIITFYFIEKRISKFQIFGICMSGLITIFAYLFNDEIFVKIKPTIFNGFFSAVLLIGILNKKAMMKQFFGSQFFLNDETWYKLSLRWGLFFLLLTIINEIAWRNLETEDWVFLKVFLLSPLVGIFMLAQLPLTLRGRINK